MFIFKFIKSNNLFLFFIWLQEVRDQLINDMPWIWFV